MSEKPKRKPFPITKPGLYRLAGGGTYKATSQVLTPKGLAVWTGVCKLSGFTATPGVFMHSNGRSYIGRDAEMVIGWVRTKRKPKSKTKAPQWGVWVPCLNRNIAIWVSTGLNKHTKNYAVLKGVRPVVKNLDAPVKRKPVVKPLNNQLSALIMAGQQLSNCAYNLAQRDHLTPRERQSLDDARKAWDAARRLSLTPKPKKRK